MPNNIQTPEVVYTPEFKRNLRQLAKKYRHIKSDVQPIINDLIQGGTPGDQIQGIGHEVFKVRAKNSDAAKGKSGGYRIIYFRFISGPIVLVTIYSKSEQTDITPSDIRQVISKCEIQDFAVSERLYKPDEC